MDCLREQFYDGVVLDGRFETVSPLNHGSFGMVFMAQDLHTNEYVAIKCLTKRSAVTGVDSSFAIDDRSEELDCHARLGNHPNIVNLIYSFETDAHIYIVLEFCSRGDLYEAIRTGTGPLQTEHVRQFMLQLVDAVAYIHSKGMYHRDIKPENIFLTHTGEMKLGDFGLATKEKWTFETNVGSDRYMSPEQYDSAGAGYAPDKADIWAIGICLLNILFSRNPFTAPTESDPLFLDFSRDKQSLFDVFPNMSQDTYEVIAQCMSLDPKKRSLDGVRSALQRVVSFTTFDESLDDFPSAEIRGIASANREPLRTPSIQSSQADPGNFPWVKALHASTSTSHYDLCTFSDDESYSEDLFPSSVESNHDWFSNGQQTPSMASVLDSSFGSSINSFTLGPPRVNSPVKDSQISQACSLPINITRSSRSGSTMEKKKNPISKSWSDLWEEEEEAQRGVTLRQLQNSRTWSQESKMCINTVCQKVLDGPLSPRNPESSSSGHSKSIDIDEDLVADGFFFHETPREIDRLRPSRHDLSTKPRNVPRNVDKWSTLGDRRRAYTGLLVSEIDSEIPRGGRNIGKVGTGLPGLGVHDLGPMMSQFKEMGFKERDKGCPWTRDRVRNYHTGRQKRHGNSGDLEWVGGLDHLHS
ncbi:hypothetical protein K3495_g147 [Podosphaera aphanis]|nr:hypothetical protein K3495_g147 [Podosphaera aphanis]